MEISPSFFLLSLRCKKEEIAQFDLALKASGCIVHNRRPKGAPNIGNISRKRGTKFEQAFTRLLKEHNLPAERNVLSGSPAGVHGDITISRGDKSIGIETKMTLAKGSITITRQTLKMIDESLVDAVVFRQGDPRNLYAIIPVEETRGHTFSFITLLKEVFYEED